VECDIGGTRCLRARPEPVAAVFGAASVDASMPAERLRCSDTRTAPDQWVSELLAAGWRKHTSTSWYSPAGQLYRGPYKAWCVMRGIQCEAPK
jgi:hypothetical protein